MRFTRYCYYTSVMRDAVKREVFASRALLPMVAEWGS